jgi:glycerophosphoryl diester phosphodiesterase
VEDIFCTQKSGMRHLLLALSAAVFLSCNHSKKMQENKPAFDLQGHRGCRGLLPENTITAMLKAVDLGVTTLEMDAVITKDSQVILSHEPFFNHEITSKADGSYVTEAEEKSLNIYKMTYEETLEFNVGARPHPRFPGQEKINEKKPLLKDVFRIVKDYCTRENLRPIPFFNIETKCLPFTDNLYHPEPGRFVELLMAVIKEAGMEEKTIIQSFDFRTLQYLHQHYPAIKTAALIEDYDKLPFEQQLEKLGFLPTIYSPAYELVTPELVKACHEKGVKLVPWTVNEPAEMQKLRSWGVDGLITDYPNLFKF